jgi:hypothetical protein
VSKNILTKQTETKLVAGEDLSETEADEVAEQLISDLREHGHDKCNWRTKLGEHWSSCAECSAGLRMWIIIQNNNANLFLLHKRAEREVLAFITACRLPDRKNT